MPCLVKSVNYIYIRTKYFDCKTSLGTVDGYFLFNISRCFCCKLRGPFFRFIYNPFFQLIAAVCNSAFGPKYYSVNFGLLFTTTFVYNTFLIVFTQVGFWKIGIINNYNIYFICRSPF